MGMSNKDLRSAVKGLLALNSVMLLIIVGLAIFRPVPVKLSPVIINASESTCEDVKNHPLFSDDS